MMMMAGFSWFYLAKKLAKKKIRKQQTIQLNRSTYGNVEDEPNINASPNNVILK